MLRGLDRDRLLVSIADAHHGIVDLDDLRSVGYGRTAIQDRARARLLIRVFHGVYLVAPHPLTRQAREQAALRACGPGSVIGLRSAAAFDRLMIWDGPVEVVTPTHKRLQRGLHPRVGDVDKFDIRERDGISYTTTSRTLADLATVLGPAELERIVHEAEFRKLLRDGPVRRAIERAGPRRNTAALLAALGRRRRLVGRVDSDPEKRFARFLAERGYPPTEHGVPFPLGGRPVHLDVLFRAQWFGVEVDGDPHKTEERFHSDRLRDLAFEAEHGLRIARVTEPQIDDTPDELDGLLWAALQRRDPSLRRGTRQIRAPIARKHL